ncbi:ectoine synthase [Roseovarius nanhaiticus]|uniref:ectoine synthase n=1 Tax=Roseovarius nanhaiticus TaxID=573024 RepID=UPI000AAC6563|nr:ectoine synthase [Roseovarius nanhaiticus]
MFVKTLSDTLGTADHVTGDAFESRRVLLARDGLGYSFHDTLIKAGSTQHLEYKNHVEANYCIAGEGEVEEVATGRTWPLTPGTMG